MQNVLGRTEETNKSLNMALCTFFFLKKIDAKDLHNVLSKPGLD